ncbi:hypothetical protein ABW19_dt0210144 [Dactylella cylindrospora]|nr:hypothetical protein ABW19_dt0210144 [Dactylella cylindrospora]
MASHRKITIVAKERPDDRTNVDTWRRTGPLPPAEAPPMRRNNSRFTDTASEAGDRFERRGSGFHSNEGGDGKFRDFNNWERKGPLPPPTPTDTQSESGRPPRHDRGDRRRSPAVNPFDRERQPSIQGEERGERQERPRREYQRPPPPERAPTAAEKDNEWRRGARPDVSVEQIKEQLKTHTTAPQTPPAPKSPAAAPPHAPSGPAKERHGPPPPSPGVPQTRPKLALQKRSESLSTESPQPTGSGDPKSSPFGAARPIDTNARMKEIEEKRAVQAAERKAKEDKVKEERKAARAAEKAEKAEKKSQKGEGDSETSSGRNYDVLRRASAATTTDDVNTADLDPEEGPETKEEPKQPAKAVPKVQLPQEPTAKQLEDEGWSTVKRGRGANGKV